MNSLMPLQRRHAPQDTALLEDVPDSTPRLTAVAGSGLLDAFAGESFDSLTRLAARLVKAPACFICHFALGSDTLVIEDTDGDALWKSVRTVDMLGVRAYVSVPIRVDGEIIGSLCVIDMKPREWQAEELETVRQIAIAAGREIGLRNAAAAARRDSANSLSLAHSCEEVVAVVAHDLRTPLQVLRLACRVLQKGADGEDAATLDRMFRSIDAMKQMADSLLSASALLAPSMTGHKTVSGGALLGEAADMMRAIAGRSGISLDYAQLSDALIHVDPAQMLRVIGNLIGNSIKYSSEGSTVHLSGRCEDGVFLISVQDRGKGMNAAEQLRAFERGWQGAQGMVQGDGAGLGLSIAKTLVTENGGTIALRSEPGAGTTVTISLSAVSEAPGPAIRAM